MTTDADRILFIENSNELELQGLTDSETGNFINTATVTVTLERNGGVEVLGATWPLTMGFVSGSNGVYRATLPAALELEKHGKYFAVITATAAGKTAKWRFRLNALTRTG